MGTVTTSAVLHLGAQRLGLENHWAFKARLSCYETIHPAPKRGKERRKKNETGLWCPHASDMEVIYGISQLKIKVARQEVVAHTLDPSIPEAEAGDLSSKPAHLGLHRETLSHPCTTKKGGGGGEKEGPKELISMHV